MFYRTPLCDNRKTLPVDVTEPISDIERSPAWIETEYNNMNNPAFFFIIGPEEPHP